MSGTESTPVLTPKIIFSSINVAAPPHGLRSLEWLGEFAAGAGYDGVEYMPAFDLLPGHTPAAVARAVKSGALALNSLHASFREGMFDSRDTNKLPGDPGGDNLAGKLLRSPLGRIILPEVTQSADVMGRIQRRVGRGMPVTLYPQRSANRDGAQIASAAYDPDKPVLFQPTDHVARLVGAGNIRDFHNEMFGVRGYDYVLDTYHARRRYGRGETGVISNTSVSVPILAPDTKAVHLSLNRDDIPGEPHIPTLEEAKKALSGEYDGELREMLDSIKESGQVGFVVVEAALGGVSGASGHKQSEDLQKDYADIAAGVRSYWAAAA